MYTCTACQSARQSRPNTFTTAVGTYSQKVDQLSITTYWRHLFSDHDARSPIVKHAMIIIKCTVHSISSVKPFLQKKIIGKCSVSAKFSLSDFFVRNTCSNWLCSLSYRRVATVHTATFDSYQTVLCKRLERATQNVNISHYGYSLSAMFKRIGSTYHWKSNIHRRPLHKIWPRSDRIFAVRWTHRISLD